jgi:hypothetical protein
MRFNVNPADAGRTFDAGGSLMQGRTMNALAQGAPVAMTPYGPMVMANPVPGQAGNMFQTNPVAYNALAENGGPTRAAAASVPTIDDPELARKISETAQSLGMDPVDLATIISYETAGTFDPTKRGPTTQWGQHRGLIQFGEPQAEKYGVDWSDPVNSQLGPDGAVARYFKASGYQPGMGLLDAYSIVNAGGPGRYNRSDANNGGAPGTVADKVNNQMAGHRQKAEALMRSLQAASQDQQATTAQNSSANALLGRYGL